MNLRTEKMKLGRRAAYLRKCIIVQQLCATYENETTIRKRVFETHIRPVILCSYTQFNNMLGERNPAGQLREIETKINCLTNKVNL